MMRTLVCFLAALAIARADLREQGPKDAKPSGLLAGVASADISPPSGIIHQNWGSATHLTALGIDPLGMHVRALVLGDGKKKYVLAELDAVNLGWLGDAAARAAAAIGVPEEHVRISASHTHAGAAFQPNRGPAGVDLRPYAGVFSNYRAAAADKVVGTIVEANSRLLPVHIGAAQGAGTINVNRRFRSQAGQPAAVGLNPEGFVDRDLLVLRIDDAGGRPYAVVFNFQCHGTVMGYENRYVSPDWIGSARKAVEQALPGATALFLQGAAGNQGPVEGYTGDLEVARRLGAVVGYQAAALALGIDTVKREPRFEGFVESTAYQAKQPWRVEGPRDATLRFSSRIVELEPRRYSAPELEAMARRVEQAQRSLAQAEASGDEWRQHQARARLRRDTDLLKRWQEARDPAPVRLLVRVLRIGEIAIVSVPGEPFAEIGAAVKKDSPFPITLFTGYSNGQGDGYMPVESEYRFGGYEIEMTPYGPGAANQLVQAAVAMLREIR
jgi:hypothetical protein